MPYTYRPRAMPRRYLEGAPAVVRAQVLDLFKIVPAAPLDFDVVLSAPVTDLETGEVYGFNGVDFGAHGTQGQHFYLKKTELRRYRDANRRKRVAWRDLPEPTQRAIVAYLEA